MLSQRIREVIAYYWPFSVAKTLSTVGSLVAIKMMIEINKITDIELVISIDILYRAQC